MSTKPNPNTPLAPKGAPRPPKGGLVTTRSMDDVSLTEQALLLRRKGHTYREIARELGVTHRKAHQLVTKAFKEQQKHATETAREMVELQNIRLESLYLALQRRVEAGSAREVEVALKVLERQAKLNGLDAPTKQEVKVAYSEYSDEELIAEAERMRVTLEGIVSAGGATPASLTLPGEQVTQAQRMQDVPLLPGPSLPASNGGDVSSPE